MVKRSAKASLSEDGPESEILNENGKRPISNSTQDGAKKIKTKSLYSQPTVKELNRLNETESLFNSNLFRLQIDEILQEVKLKEKTVKKFDEWFQSLKKHLESVSTSSTEYDLSENTLYKELKVKSPLSEKLKKTKCTFKFKKCNNTQIVGSYCLGTQISSKMCVDVQITVPEDTYTKNDSINYRYHKKRAAYLVVITAHLKKFDIIEDIKYSWVNNSEYLPILLITPSGKLGKHITVCINLVCDGEAYKLHRFSPSRNNLRESWLFGVDRNENEVGPPTPYYNSSILKDVTAESNQEYLKQTFENYTNLQQAVVLLKIWLRQRKLDVSGFVISMFVAHLVQNKRINNIMSSYQIVRNVWIALQSSEWNTKGITLHKGDAETPSVEEFLEHFPVVFLDVTGYYNICWQMCLGTYNALKRESGMAVDMLDNGKINSFIPLFMTPYKPLLQFDHILRIKDFKKVKEAVYKTIPKDSQLNYGIDKTNLVINTLHTLLTKGLGKRVHLILQNVEKNVSWSIKESADKVISGFEEEVMFGFVLNNEYALEAIEKGPPANLPEAEAFRAFWGDKSELRRFQDGSITETCVWHANSMADRRMITKQIVMYLLELKYGIGNYVHYIGDQLDSVLIRKQFLPPDKIIGTGEENAMKVIEAFDNLRRDLRSITDLPLEITSVYGTSPVFSVSDPLPPLPYLSRSQRNSQRIARAYDNSPYVPVSNVVLELGHSGKWPSDLEPFRCVKAAFYQQLAAKLSSTAVSKTHLDVNKDGYVFRLQIAHPKEVNLLRKYIEKGVVKYRDTEESLDLQIKTVALPRIRGALHGLHQSQASFGPTSCLVKRWLSSQLLDEVHFSGETIELLVASVYLRCQPWGPPAQALTGFVRTLRLLAETDWSTEIIILDFNDDMDAEQISSIENHHTPRNPDTPLVISTSLDATPNQWGRISPSTACLARTAQLARVAITSMEGDEDNMMKIFVPSTKGYDVIIHLDPRLVPNRCERVDQPALLRNMVGEVSEEVPVCDFHLVKKYVRELRSAFSDFAVFFYDQYGGEYIAVLWKPDIDEMKEFQVSTINGMKSVQTPSGPKFVANKEAIVADFKILGEGLVKEVTVY